MKKTGQAVILAAALMAGDVRAQGAADIGDIQSGRNLAMRECRACHRVGLGSLRLKQGPPAFYDIANMASMTPTSLYVFLHTSHPTMPNFRLDKKESDDVIAYIISLRRQSP